LIVIPKRACRVQKEAVAQSSPAMSSDASDASEPDSDSRSSAIHFARAQVDAARRREQQLHASGRLAAPLAAPPPTSLPGYTLLRELHRGGQGVVYLGVQESTNRQVAIKVLHRELSSGRLGAVAALARFEREIEILSRLKHPNIVTIHDCGRDHGHVYLVMDYVDGRALDAWVRREGTTRARTLEVFARVCDGVNAAHLLGVIHRDLKPGNILVDQRGEPHLLDFGLAKLADPPGDALAAGSDPPEGMTVTGQFVGSMPWASPEQAEGRTDALDAPLDIRTDVYSLGVILYQLLTGRFPYPVSGRLREVVRHIVESDPARPSTIDRTIDRELETIVLKCLAKQPERRYQNAGDLARDLRRYLAGEAIEARRDSLAYVMTKRIARYRAAALATAAMLLVVVVALGISIAFWRQADRHGVLAREAAQRADLEAEQARAVTDFMREVLTSVEPQNQGADVRLIDVLANASNEASRRFGDHPFLEAQVRDLLGQVYERLSMWAPARAEFERAEGLWRRSAGPDDVRALESAGSVVMTLLHMLQTAPAEKILAQLVPRMERVLGPDDPRTLSARRSVAITHLFRGRADEAERRLLELRAHPRIADDDDAQTRIIRALVAVHSSRLVTTDLQRRREILIQAEALAAEWIQRATRLSGPDALMTLQARIEWAELACGLGRFHEAVEECRQILKSIDGRLSPCHYVKTNAQYALAEALAGLGEDAEPADLQLQRIECLRQQLGADNLLFLTGLSGALPYLERAGERLAAESEALTRELLDGVRARGGGHAVATFMPEFYLARFVSMQNRLDEADALFDAVFAQETEQQDSPRMLACLRVFYADHLVRLGRFEEAESALNSAVALVGDVRLGTWDSHPDDIVLGFASLYQAWGKPDKLREFQKLRQEIRDRRATPKQRQEIVSDE
jgi:eukaryotic-like serine/threonine-protein kinase